MSAYPLVALGEVMVSRGGSLDPRKSPDERFELYSIPAHDQGQAELVSGKEIGSSKQLVEPGDVILSKIVPHIRRVQVVPPNSSLRQIASSEWIVFRSQEFYPPYLRHFLLSDLFHHQFMNTVAGVGGSLLRARPSFVKKIKVALPPLAEQRRIADILDKATAIHQKRQQALDYLDTLSQSIFHEMFDGFIANATVGEVMSIQGGLQVSARRNSLPIEIPYLRVANAFRGYLDLREIKTMRASEAEIDRTRLANGDLLFVEGHANILEVGRVSMWSTEIENCVHQNHLIRGRVDNHRILPIFAMYWLNSNAGASHFRRTGKTTSGLNTINVTTVRSAPIPLPPINLQHRFAERISSITKQRSSLKSILAADSELFASLQARAFRGEL